MCGILGMAFLNEHKRKDPEIPKTILRRLLIESRIRGRDATGVAFASHTDIDVVKHNIKADDFINTDFYTEAEKYLDDPPGAFGKVNVIIGHTRQQTKGTHRNRDNNHPVVANRVIGVHNGCIANDDALFDEYTKTFPGMFVRRAWVDTEIIFRLINHYRHTINVPMYDAVEATNDLINGGYACAFIDAAEPWMLWLFRDWSPTVVYLYPKVGYVIFASSEFFIRTAVKDMDLGDPIEVEYEKESCLAINTITNKFTRFGFAKKHLSYNQGCA